MKSIIIKGAREHNLKNIDIELPRDKMIVISGKSGSGKSSLAFDTIFAEGQRRYVESLSAYARQFLGKANKPDLDYIEGLSPAISIEQKTTSKNPRSTVGTITEIYDYLRLFYARVGKPTCPKCKTEIFEQSIDQIIEKVKCNPDGEKMLILSPVVNGRKGEHKKVIEDARKSGFTRIRVNGEVLHLDDEIKLSKTKKHSIEIVVDRVKLSSEVRKRLSESIETALEVSGGNVIINYIDKDTDEFFSEHNSCSTCGFSMDELQPRLFSFNSPFGACPECSGLGRTMDFDPNKIIPDKSLSYKKGAVTTSNPKSAWSLSMFKGLSKHYGFSLDTPFDKLDPKMIEIMLYGTTDKIEILYENREKTGKFEINKAFSGIISDLRRRYKETNSPGMRDWYEKLMTDEVCTTCKGKRLKPEALSVFVNEKNIAEITSLSVQDALSFFENCKLSESEEIIAEQILKEIRNRLKFLQSVGLSYLNLNRKSGTLSGGESQRIRLATQIGASLVGVLYILDEPTIGLHQRDNDRLLATLTHLRDIGNTLIVVEHDEQTIKMADYIVDMGPGAGIHGGNIVAEGSYEEIINNPDSPTGQFLSGAITIEVPKKRREGNGKQIIIKGAAQNNLKNIDVSFDLGKLNVITGVSGSGKSTLLSQILYPALANSINRGSNHPVGKYKEILGLEHLDKVINIDQSPIGRTPRSNPATYVGVFTHIRDLFSSLPESKLRGYKPGRFSFNVKGGRCEHCGGGGTKKIEMHFLPDVYVQCDVCKGKRFNTETLNVRYKGKNIYEVLAMSIEEANDFFKNIPPVKRKLETLLSVGLGYINLGQSAITLSGGEAQRVKLALELSKRSTGKTIYIIDEPTTGLHFADVKQLMEVLHDLVDTGNTAILIEHNLDVIKCADKILDLGPEGGDNGGKIIAVGTPEEITKCKKSYTGLYLKEVLGK
ncbi:MAG: excinuclease ABC subunit UvrA [Spirochaetaceae bacterium]